MRKFRFYKDEIVSVIEDGKVYCVNDVHYIQGMVGLIVRLEQKRTTTYVHFVFLYVHSWGVNFIRKVYPTYVVEFLCCRLHGLCKHKGFVEAVRKEILEVRLNKS